MDEKYDPTSLLPLFSELFRSALKQKGLSPTAFALSHGLDGNSLRRIGRGEPPGFAVDGTSPDADPKFQRVAEALWPDYGARVRWYGALADPWRASRAHANAGLTFKERWQKVNHLVCVPQCQPTRLRPGIGPDRLSCAASF